MDRKDGVFDKQKEFYETLADSLTVIGHPELVPLLGEIIPGGKERVPLQAADLVCWYSARRQTDTLNRRDAVRFETLGSRPGKICTFPDGVVQQLAQAFTDKMNE